MMSRLRETICKWWFSDEELREAVTRIERADDRLRQAQEAAREAKEDLPEERNEE